MVQHSDCIPSLRAEVTQFPGPTRCSTSRDGRPKWDFSDLSATAWGN